MIVYDVILDGAVVKTWEPPLTCGLQCLLRVAREHYAEMVKEHGEAVKMKRRFQFREEATA